MISCSFYLLSSTVSVSHFCVWVCWLEPIITCGSLYVYVHALSLLWQSESVCAHNEQGVSEALYCIIPLYSTPEGRKWSKLRLISPYITVCVFVKSPTHLLSLVSLTEAQPWGLSKEHMYSTSIFTFRSYNIGYSILQQYYYNRETTETYSCSVVKAGIQFLPTLQTKPLIYETIHPILGWFEVVIILRCKLVNLKRTYKD